VHNVYCTILPLLSTEIRAALREGTLTCHRDPLNGDRLRFLTRYLEAISPSGYEASAAALWRDEAARFAEHVWSDSMGNSFAVWNEVGRPRVMLAGHTDELGLLITHVEDEGFLRFATIGGWDLHVLPGQRVRIATAAGPILGLVGRTPTHLLHRDHGKDARDVRIEDLWIDIAATSKASALERVRIGDPAVLDYGPASMDDACLVARGLDNRIGAFVVLETIRILASSPALEAAVFGVATVQEEVGTRGAIAGSYALNPDIGIAVDVGHATDTPGMREAKKRHGEIALGAGPILTRSPNVTKWLFELLVSTAETRGIPYQIRAQSTPSGTDARAMQVTRAGVITALVSIPNRYMHTPCEMVHLEDVRNAARLIAATVQQVHRLEGRWDLVR